MAGGFISSRRRMRGEFSLPSGPPMSRRHRNLMKPEETEEGEAMFPASGVESCSARGMSTTASSSSSEPLRQPEKKRDRVVTGSHWCKPCGTTIPFLLGGTASVAWICTARNEEDGVLGK